MERCCRIDICNGSRLRCCEQSRLRDVQKGRLARPQRTRRRSVLVPYVELLKFTTPRIRSVTLVNAAEMVRRQCLAGTELASFFSIPPDGLHTFAQQSLIFIERHQIGKQHEQLRSIFGLDEALVFQQV